MQNKTQTDILPMKSMFLFAALAIFFCLTTNAQAIAEGKLASHNSLTFAQNINGNDRIVDRRNRCQSLDIQEQYAVGVRMFDFRVRPDKDGKAQAAHGRIVYDVNLEKEYEWLNSKGDVWIRIMIENSRLPWKKDSYFEWFRKYTAELVKKYPNIRFVGGYGARGGGQVADKLLHQPQINQYIWSISSGNGIVPAPERFAKENNIKNKTMINNESWSMFDFVEYLFIEED